MCFEAHLSFSLDELVSDTAREQKPQVQPSNLHAIERQRNHARHCEVIGHDVIRRKANRRDDSQLHNHSEHDILPFQFDPIIEPIIPTHIKVYVWESQDHLSQFSYQFNNLSYRPFRLTAA